ncbi:MAG TPA: pantetheine-phosphate adenylyltransferase [Nitrososphaerales archaeon]|nr:pantetheine-phosphate adenylyltransferase [Nitrososphaerales archaeon]
MNYGAVATGGTFDHIHKGHEALLSKSFEVGQKVIIGVTSDGFAAREGKTLDESYARRVEKLEALLHRKFPGRQYVIAKLDDYFGPGIASPEVEAIVVSKETEQRVPIANALRAERGYPPLKVVVVDYVLAEDSKPISSTRIRNGEVDERGRVLGRTHRN